MRTSLLALALLFVASSARADAIQPFHGECPPGTQRAVVSHAEACMPMGCENDAACGAGASCQTLCVCRAEREFRGDGRVIYPSPVRRVVEVGLCSAEGRCSEGQVARRRQCEPTEPTDAFDRRRHEWTGRPYVRDSAPSTTGCASTGTPARGGSLALSAAIVLLLVRRRRASRAAITS